jgi:hypothetical protein
MASKSGDVRSARIRRGFSTDAPSRSTNSIRIENSYVISRTPWASIVRWSLSKPRVQSMFDNLRVAKKDPGDKHRLERAIDAYRAFEIESSEFAVALLSEVGEREVIPFYTNFMRADLEALTEYHRTGQAPIWRDFFDTWNENVAANRQIVAPFPPKPIPSFKPTTIETQEIIQKQ